jgi:hypothetical protein
MMTKKAPRGARTLPEYGRDIEREVSDLASSVQDAAGEVRRSLATQLEERPYATLAIAAAAGYVLGGGLATRMTRTLLAIGGRLALALLVQETGGHLGLVSRGRQSTQNGNRT